MSSGDLYNRLVQITEAYLGPAASRFVSRQAERHLHKDPHLIEPQDLSKLGDEIKVSLALLTQDRELVDDFTQRIGVLKTDLAQRSE